MSDPIYPGGAQPPSAASELRRSVAEATRKIHRIIDAAEQAANEIRQEAQGDAERYLRLRRDEIDRELLARRDEVRRSIDLVAARAAATSRPLLDRADGLRLEVEALARELDGLVLPLRSLAGSTAGLDHLISDQPAPAPLPPEVPETPPAEAAGAVVIQPAEAAPPYPTAPGDAGFVPRVPSAQPSLAQLVETGEAAAPSQGPTPIAYPGTGAAPPEAPIAPPPAAEPEAARPVDEEVLLRATQMAIAGSGRDEIESALRAEFGVEDASALVDSILGLDGR